MPPRQWFHGSTAYSVCQSTFSITKRQCCAQKNIRQIALPDVKKIKRLQLGASLNQSLAFFVAGVLGKVLDETSSQILSLGLPLGSVGIGIAGIQDVGVNAGQLGGNSQVEVGDGLVSAFRMEPSRMASMMPRVSLMEIRLPVPFQPVLTR